MATSVWTKAQPRRFPLIEYVAFHLDEAAEKVMANKGSAGIDGMECAALPNLLKEHGETIRQKLKQGRYIPSPVRRVDIPKPNGGTRMLGIPTVLDRTIQQAIVMTLEGIFEEQFSENSFGFRKGRSAHMGCGDRLVKVL